jgi:cytochrome c oxidase subunit 4
MSEHHSDEHEHEHEHGGLGQYIAVFLALCILTSASFFTCSSYWPFHDTPSIGWAFMMAVSLTKAMLVILFFMHVKYETSWKYVLTIPPAFMAVFLMLMLVPDIGMRGRILSEERRSHMGNEEQAEALRSIGHDDADHGADSHGAGSNSEEESKHSDH